MHFTITIPQGLPEMTVKELLEEHFLIDEDMFFAYQKTCLRQSKSD